MQIQSLPTATGYIHEVCGELLTLLPQKAIYWAAKKILIISDLHLGKATHFRKHGLPVPSEVADYNFLDLDALMLATQPKEVILLGDLFHSKINSEWEAFRQWRCQHEGIAFHLVMGNHDILKKETYHECQLTMYALTYQVLPFVFSHEPLNDATLGYNLAGHIHPSVKVMGKGRQSIKLTCFHFSPLGAVLPAFGNFTGSCIIKPEKTDDVFLILENSVVKM